MEIEKFENQKIDSSTIVIIGAGTMGLFLAHGLMKDGKKVLLIEAGTETIEYFSSEEYKIVGHAHDGVSIGQTKGFGGTSNLWGGQLTEFIRNDVDSKNELGQPAWPIKWEEVFGFYKMVYNNLGLNGEMIVEAEELKKNELSGDIELFYTRWLKQPNFKFHFLNDLKNSPNVMILKNSIVMNLNFTGHECTSISFLQNGDEKLLAGFRKAILANGTIETVRLLLIAGELSNCPFSGNRNIGKYFQDHLNIRVGEIKHVSKVFFRRFSNSIRKGEKLQPKIRIIQKGENNPYFGISGIFSFDSKVSHHLDNFKQFSKAVLGRSNQKVNIISMIPMVIKSFKALPQISLIIYNYVKNNRIYVPFKSSVSFNLQTQQITIYESQIRISENEFDQYGRPKVILDWKLDGREFAKVREFCFEVKKYFQNNQLGDLQIESWIENEASLSKHELLSHVSDTYHQAGGAIMSENETNGVVDSNLKVHQTSNLFICGASVMPTSSYANTALTALALTARLNKHLSEN
jgi:choline dehydrogenase-like flavoprotein